MSTSKHVLPYRILPERFLVPTSGWTVRLAAKGEEPRRILNEVQLEDDDPLEAWDASSLLQLSRTYRQSESLDAIPGFGGIPSDSLEIVLGTATARGRYRQTVYRTALQKEKDSEYALTCEVQGESLARDLVLQVSVVVRASVPQIDLLSPTMVGSRLWEESTRFHLEGGKTLLSIREGDFTKMFPGEGMEHADFHVILDQDLSQPIEQAMVVYLNVRQSDFLKAARLPGTHAEEQLHYGVIRRAVTMFLLRDDYDGAGAGGEESAHQAISAWISQIWRYDSRAVVRDRLISNSAQLEAQIESWFRQVTRPSGGEKKS